MKTFLVYFVVAIFFIPYLNGQSTEAKIAYNNAVSAFSAKDYGGAVNLLEAVVESEPDFIQAQRLIAESYKGLKDEKGTQKHYKEVLRIQPNQPDVWYRYGTSYSRDGNDEAAKEAFAKVLEFNPNHKKAKIKLERLQEIPQEYDTEAVAQVGKEASAPAKRPKESEQDVAVESSKDAKIELTKETKETVVEKDNSKEIVKEHDTEALAQLGKGANTPPVTKDQQTAKSGKDVVSAEVKQYSKKGVGYYNEKQFKEAARSFDKAIESGSTSPKLYSYAARSHMHMGDSEQAILYLKRAIAKDSDNGEYHYYLSKAFELKGMVNLMDKYASMAKTRGFGSTNEIFNNQGVGYYNKGVDFYKAKKYKDAVLAYEQAIEANPNRANYHYNLAVAHFSMKHNKESKDALTNAMTIDPTYPHAYKLMGDILYNEREYRKAAPYYEEAVVLGVNTYNAYLNVGYCHDKLENYKKALQYFEQAESLNPTHKEVMFTVAMAYFKVNEITKSKDRFIKLVEADPKNIRALTNASSLCARTGDFEQALEYVMAWIEVDPNDGEAYSQAGDILFNMGKGDEGDKYKRKAKSLGVKRDFMHF